MLRMICNRWWTCRCIKCEFWKHVSPEAGLQILKRFVKEVMAIRWIHEANSVSNSPFRDPRQLLLASASCFWITAVFAATRLRNWICGSISIEFEAFHIVENIGCVYEVREDQDNLKKYMRTRRKLTSQPTSQNAVPAICDCPFDSSVSPSSKTLFVLFFVPRLELWCLFCETVRLALYRLQGSLLTRPQSRGWHGSLCLATQAARVGPVGGPCFKFAYCLRICDCGLVSQSDSSV